MEDLHVKIQENHLLIINNFLFRTNIKLKKPKTKNPNKTKKMSECACENDYLYYCVTVYVVITWYLFNTHDAQEKYLKKKLAQEKELNNDLLELMGYKRK